MICKVEVLRYANLRQEHIGVIQHYWMSTTRNIVPVSGRDRARGIKVQIGMGHNTRRPDYVRR